MNPADHFPSGFVVLCCACEKGRDSAGNWVVYPQPLLKEGVTYSHAVCPECLERIYGREQWYRDYVRVSASNRK